MHKRLRQIAALEAKQTLSEAERAKVSRKGELEAQLEELETEIEEHEAALAQTRERRHFLDRLVARRPIHRDRLG